jgi:Nucleotide-diphospho-sugar transferase
VSLPVESRAHAAIVTAVERAQGEATPVIAFADSRYLDVLLNWLVGLAAIGVRHYVVIALDRPLYDFLVRKRVPAVLAEHRGDLRALWIERIGVFAALNHAGLDFVHSDADAVWMRDPGPAFFNRSEADLVASQGTVWPPDVHARFGFVLCCGLFRLASNARTRALLAELAGHVLATGDDQVSLNRLVAARDMRWQVQPGDGYAVHGAGKQFLCARNLIQGVGGDGLRVAVLPHHLFQRVPVTTPDPPYVLHLLSAKEPVAKLREFERHGCLLLRPDWREVDFDVDTLLALRRADGTPGHAGRP